MQPEQPATPRQPASKQARPKARTASPNARTARPKARTYVELFNLSKSYPTPSGPVKVVRDFNLKMVEGEVVALIGHSGCGKSTVLNIVAGLTRTSTGSILLADREVDAPGTDRGVVFQAPCLLPWLSAFENVLLGARGVYPRATRAQVDDLVRYYLTLVGLGEALHQMPAELSRGMQQRVGIARAFALGPRMLLLDEPFGMLDSLTRMELQETLLELLERTPKTTLMVTHDVDEALFLSDRVVMMTNGPEARVGRILEVPFRRPRQRAEVLEHPAYYDLRAEVIEFLESQDHRRLEHFPTAATEEGEASSLDSQVA
jgi:nitrate ABC transporter ATP-binding subunit